MRKIIVGEHEFDAMYAGVNPVTNRFKTQVYYGNKRLSELADIFDGAEEIIYTDDDKTETFEHYSRLTEISFVDDETAAVLCLFEEVSE